MSSVKQNPKIWSAWRKSNYTFFKEALRGLPKGSKLIDLGAGELQFIELFGQFNYTGVDFVAYEGVDIITDLTKNLPIPNSSVDIVTLSNTIEHIPNTTHLLTECKRILKPGGIIIATVPFLMQVHQEPYDYNRYTHYQLKKILEDIGFKDIEVVPLGNLVDTYNNIELKFFDLLLSDKSGGILRIIRLWRRMEMRVIRWLVSSVPSVGKHTQGYGFSAKN